MSGFSDEAISFFVQGDCYRWRARHKFAKTAGNDRQNYLSDRCQLIEDKGITYAIYTDA